MRNSIPTQAEVEGQTPGGSPVILNISKPGNTVPVSVVFEGSFAVAAGEAKQEIGKIVAGEIPVKSEVALGGCLQWLQLAEVQPSAAELPLMSSPRPGQVIANLIAVGNIAPWPPVRVVTRSCLSTRVQVDDWSDVGRTAKQLMLREARIGQLVLAGRKNVDAIAAIVERYFVE